MKEQGFLAYAVAMVVKGGEGLLPLLEWMSVPGAVQQLVATLGESHHLTHNGHVEFTPAQLSSIASNTSIVLG